MTKKLHNGRLTVFCDNKAVVHMVNNTASACKQCRKLIRILTLENLRCNRRIFVNHVTSKNNFLADSLSRMDIVRFFRLAARTVDIQPTEVQFMTADELFNSEVHYLN